MNLAAPDASVPVWVTRPQGQEHGWTQALRAAGWDAHDVPTLRLEPFADAARENVLANAPFDALMFVSQAAVRHFFFSNPHRNTSHGWARRYWCTGPGTQQALLEFGVPVEEIDSPRLASPQWDSEALWQVVQSQLFIHHPARHSAPERGPELRPHPSRSLAQALRPFSVLLVRGADPQGQAAGRNWLHERLTEAGASVHTLCVYQRRLIERQAQPGIWVLSSSFSVQALTKGDWGQCDAIATHERIARAAVARGFRQVWVCSPTIQSLLECLKRHVGSVK